MKNKLIFLALVFGTMDAVTWVYVFTQFTINDRLLYIYEPNKLIAWTELVLSTAFAVTLIAALIKHWKESMVWR